MYINSEKPKFAVVGAGFAGAVIARSIADNLREKVLVVDRRPHVAGNCYTERDPHSGVMIHTYGPHIFHTSCERVWRYVTKFGEFVPFRHRVKATTDRGVFSLPINLHTINQFFGTAFGPDEARRFIQKRSIGSVEAAKNFTELSLALVGSELYEEFLHGYTLKQWGCQPELLPASILKRFCIRFNYNDEYYDDRYQALPRLGYTALVEAILSHPNIQIALSTSITAEFTKSYKHVFYTGPIDEFFNFSEGRLGYRGLKWKRIDCSGDLQGTAVMNFPSANCAYTRITEHKHLAPWEEHKRSVAFQESSFEANQGQDCFYPKRLEADMGILVKYEQRLAMEPNVTALGRLGSYRYLDMDKVIAEALQIADRFCEKHVGI